MRQRRTTRQPTNSPWAGMKKRSLFGAAALPPLTKSGSRFLTTPSFVRIPVPTELTSVYADGVPHETSAPSSLTSCDDIPDLTIVRNAAEALFHVPVVTNDNMKKQHIGTTRTCRPHEMTLMISPGKSRAASRAVHEKLSYEVEMRSRGLVTYAQVTDPSRFTMSRLRSS